MKLLKDAQRAHVHFTYGENIGTSRSPIRPAILIGVRPGRPVVLDLWAAPNACAWTTYTTVGTWNRWDGKCATRRKASLDKRREWLQYLKLPTLTGASFEDGHGCLEKCPTTTSALRDMLENHRASDLSRDPTVIGLP